MNNQYAYRITKTVSFDAAHRLPEHRGKCRNLHGHTFKLVVELGASKLYIGGSSNGMVMDFGDLKPILKELEDEYDHATILTTQDPLYPHFHDLLVDNQLKLVTLARPPTSEVLAYTFGRRIIEKLKAIPMGNDVTLLAVTVYETCTAAGIWVNPDA